MTYNRSLMIFFSDTKSKSNANARVKPFNPTLDQVLMQNFKVRPLNVEFLTEYVDGGTRKAAFRLKIKLALFFFFEGKNVMIWISC